MDMHGNKVLQYFKEISRIPHGSGNEKAISDYLTAFARERRLNVVQDEYYNVVIKKRGVENTKPIIIQGHMDMVCEKNNGTSHDFFVDPISVIIDGDSVHADKTTLGADNGIALAMALALLDAEDIVHPDLEVLFTADEEEGMTGAIHLDAASLTGKILLNLDSEDEGIFCTSCAGGLRMSMTIPVRYIPRDNKHSTYIIRIDGLKGGHSGMEIHLERANSNRLLGRVLKTLNDNTCINIAEITGGLKLNAIPREAEAVVTIDNSEINSVMRLITGIRDEIEKEYRVSDPGVRITIEPTADIDNVFTTEDAKNIITALILIPNGVQSMSMYMPGIVETSNNIGVIRTETGATGDVIIECLLRSSVSSKKRIMAEQIKVIGELLNAKVEESSDYPSWEYDPDSELRKIAVNAYVNLYGRQPEVTAIHAGLECGIFAEKINGIDMISFGPDIRNAHTPDECMSVSSVNRVWEYLIELLKRLSE